MGDLIGRELLRTAARTCSLEGRSGLFDSLTLFAEWKLVAALVTALLNFGLLVGELLVTHDDAEAVVVEVLRCVLWVGEAVPAAHALLELLRLELGVALLHQLTHLVDQSHGRLHWLNRDERFAERVVFGTHRRLLHLLLQDVDAHAEVQLEANRLVVRLVGEVKATHFCIELLLGLPDPFFRGLVGRRDLLLTWDAGVDHLGFDVLGRSTFLLTSTAVS